MSQRLRGREENKGPPLAFPVLSLKTFPITVTPMSTFFLENCLEVAILENVLWGATCSRGEGAPCTSPPRLGHWDCSGAWPGAGRL